MPIVIDANLILPDELYELSASRGSGPGGQNVNKVSSRVELWVDLARWTDLPEGARERLVAREHRRITKDGRLRIVCQIHRDQGANRELCLERFVEMVRAALVAPTPRRPTRPSRAARRRRLEDKRIRSELKRSRCSPGGDA